MDTTDNQDMEPLPFPKGRKKKNPEDRKINFFTLRITQSEIDLINGMALQYNTKKTKLVMNAIKEYKANRESKKL